MNFSLKNATFSSLETALRNNKKLRGENSGLQEVCFLTAGGFIMGTIVASDQNAKNESTQIETEKKKIGFDLSVVGELRRNALSDFTRNHPKAEIVDISALINLKDVTIFSTANPEQQIKLPEMIVFADQIIGFALNT